MTDLNADRGRFAAVRTSEMDWQPSPSPGVWRKRVELVGSAETGLVTSVVRYQAGGAFAEHRHPEGEEFLVLEGTFSDETGDYPAGSYVLNPPGSHHTPFSRDGCVLFVKLRQFAGVGREHLAIHTGEGTWQRTALSGQEILPLYRQRGFPETMRLTRLAAGIEIPPHDHTTGAEIFILSGGYEDGTGRYRKGDWIRYPPGSRHGMSTGDGCTFRPSHPGAVAGGVELVRDGAPGSVVDPSQPPFIEQEPSRYPVDRLGGAAMIIPRETSSSHLYTLMAYVS